jgi:hypothetical protein
MEDREQLLYKVETETQKEIKQSKKDDIQRR